MFSFVISFTVQTYTHVSTIIKPNIHGKNFIYFELLLSELRLQLLVGVSFVFDDMFTAFDWILCLFICNYFCMLGFCYVFKRGKDI